MITVFDQNVRDFFFEKCEDEIILENVIIFPHHMHGSGFICGYSNVDFEGIIFNFN